MVPPSPCLSVCIVGLHLRPVDGATISLSVHNELQRQEIQGGAVGVFYNLVSWNHTGKGDSGDTILSAITHIQS